MIFVQLFAWFKYDLVHDNVIKIKMQTKKTLPLSYTETSFTSEIWSSTSFQNEALNCANWTKGALGFFARPKANTKNK